MDYNQIMTFGAAGGVLLLMSSGWYFWLAGTFIFCLIIVREWVQGGKCRSQARLDGKTVVITGANTGIGYETAKELSQRGAKIIMGSRNLEKSQKAAKSIVDLTGNSVHAFALDLSSLSSVRKFSQEVLKTAGDKIDILINNAGIMMIEETITVDGNEKQMQVNHIGHFLLTQLLMPNLIRGSARIINVSSLAHTWTNSFDLHDLNMTKGGYGRIQAYAKSKLANILFTKELHRRFKGHGVSSFAVHPGTVATELSSHIEAWFPNLWNQTGGEFMKIFFLKTANSGAQTSIYCAVAEGLEDESGNYFSDCQTKMPSKLALDEDLQQNFWILSEEIVGKPTEPLSEDNVIETVSRASTASSEGEVEKDVQEELIAEKLESSEDEKDQEQIHETKVDENIPLEEPRMVICTETLPLEEPPRMEICTREMFEDPAKEEPHIESCPREMFEDPTEDDISINRTYETQETRIITDDQEIESRPRSSSSSSSSDEEEQEMENKDLLQNIEGFDKTNLKNVETLEKSTVPDSEIIEEERKMVANETLENKVLFGQVTEELNIEEGSHGHILKSTETKEILNLPDKYDILKEKAEDAISQEVESFDQTSLKPVKTLETDHIEAMKTQEDLKKNIETFDKTESLKPTELMEKINLPTSDDIAQEKELIETETQANKEVFQKTILKTLESFDATELKHVETHETTIQEKSFKEGYTQEKTHQNLLNEIEMLDEVKLAPVRTIEPMSATELAKSELSRNVVLQEVSNFDTSNLTSVTTYETDIVESMKKEENLKKDIASFDVTQLKATEPMEKITLPTSDEIEQEKEMIETETQANKDVFQKTVLKTLESFDASELKHVETSETKIDESELKESYLQEKTHQKLLSEIEMLEEVQLAPVKTMEPMSPTDLAKTEMSRNATFERLNSFDKTTLKNTLTEEKVVLPDVNTISMEKEQLERGKVLEDIENFEASDLKPTEMKERISLPTEEQIHTERLNRELITEEAAVPVDTEDNRGRSSSGGSTSSGSQQTSSAGSWEKVEDQEKVDDDQ